MNPVAPATTLDDLTAEFLVALERGEAPDPADFIARHPEHAAELAEFIANLGHFGSLLGLSDVRNADVTADWGGAATQSDVPTGEAFGEYELLGEIGRGAMGIVYRARVTGTKLVVALKRLQARDDDREATQRFRDEIQSVSGLRHPNIVPVYHVGLRGTEPFFTMGLVDGGGLDLHLTRYRNDWQAIARLMVKVAKAVHHAHQRQIIHRDLKPANILLDEEGSPHVADFGLAARTDPSGTAADAGQAGSLPWMAPEVLRGERTLTTAVDVYSLGVILYELLTGQRPFRGANRAEIRAAILGATPVPPRSVNPRAPRDLEAICLACLKKEPEQRYESASAVALECDRWLRGVPIRRRPQGRGERFARWCWRNPGATLGAVVLLAGLVGVSITSTQAAAEQRERLEDAVCKNCEYDAALVANAVTERFGQLGDEVLRTADDPRMREACAKSDWRAVASRLRELADDPVGSTRGARPFQTVFVLDPEGVLRETSGGRSNVRGVNFCGRDYFTGALRRGSHVGRNRVHVSRVFHSFDDNSDKVAVSVPFRPPGATADWVLAATVTTNRDLGVVSFGDERHSAILVAPRDASPHQPGAASQPEEYLIIVHDWYEQGRPAVRFGSETPGRPPKTTEPELRPRPPSDARPFPVSHDYRDPLAEGRWLTGSARVGGTELVVVVQQRYDEAVSSHQFFLRRVLLWIGVPLVAGLLLFLSLRFTRRLNSAAVPET